MKIRYSKFTILILLMTIICPSFALGSSDKLPEVMVGQTKLIDGDNYTYYNGANGSEIVYNYAIAGNTMQSDDNSLLGFDQSKIVLCSSGVILTSVSSYCFGLNRSSSSIGLMTSQTSINGTPVTEVATLFYSASPIIVGDSYTGGSDLNNFAYWGKHLAISNGSTSGSDSYWGIGNYTLNPNVQASLDPNTSLYKTYLAKINTLSGEAKNVQGTLTSQNWSLQGETINTVATAADKAKYPEGKLWNAGSNLNLDKNKNFLYNGSGTIIVTSGALKIGDNTTLAPSTDQDHLGIIVLGDVEIGANCDIHASIFSTGSIKMKGSNTTMTGSFVAQKFEGMDKQNLRFYYDYNLSNSWPPGFRYLNMPHPE